MLDFHNISPASIITQFVNQKMCWCMSVGAPRTKDQLEGLFLNKFWNKSWQWKSWEGASQSCRGEEWFVPADRDGVKKKKKPIVQLQDFDISRPKDLTPYLSQWFSCLHLQKSPGGYLQKCGYLGPIPRDSNLGDANGLSTLLLRNTAHSK